MDGPPCVLDQHRRAATAASNPREGWPALGINGRKWCLRPALMHGSVMKHISTLSSEFAVSEPTDPDVQVFSNSLRDARRNADSILQSAQNSEPVLRIRSGLDQWETSVRADVLRAQKSATQQLERLKLAEPFSAGFARPKAGGAADDGALIKRLTQGGEGKKLPGMRRVKSSADMARPRRSTGKSTALAKTGTPRGVPHTSSDVAAAAAQWDLVSALQNSITSVNGRTPSGQPMYPMLPAPGLIDGKFTDGQVRALTRSSERF